MRNQYWKFLALCALLSLACGKIDPASSKGSGISETFVLPSGGAMEMQWIDPGMFRMGSPEDEEGRNASEGPQHEVTISQGFYIGKYEVTQAQWTQVMGTSPWLERVIVVPEGPEHAAVMVSFNDAQLFVVRMNIAAGVDSLYRLPTEAEWEYACRAGTATAWSFGDSPSRLSSHAWFGDVYAHEVGKKSPNPWELYDMHGNVWEFCEDRYSTSYDTDSPSVDPTGPSEGNFRVVRGGNFSSGVSGTRCAARWRTSRTARNSVTGFRVVRKGP
ncbi:MAG: formylglycine-generating enzyme family protein [bacterium]|nr:formylglycine-generating enzyme family protein [bacterium]